MVKWEYKTSALTATELNKEGLAGWELVCCTSMHYVFKRPLPEGKLLELNITTSLDITEEMKDSQRKLFKLDGVTGVGWVKTGLSVSFLTQEHMDNFNLTEWESIPIVSKRVIGEVIPY